jgi:transposase-like protein
LGTLELRAPQDRQGLFQTEVFKRHKRRERALLLSSAEMYVQGASTRKVKAVTEQLADGGCDVSAEASGGVAELLVELFKEGLVGVG